mgnify:CR=1 FL=1
MYIKNTLFVGKVLLGFEALASTNGYAAELLTKSRPIEGTVISTFRQTAGRGQIGSHWESEPDKNIALSIILYPTFIIPLHQFYLNMAIAIAVRDVIAKYTKKRVKIKWPNDIYVETRKITGMLIQNTLAANTLHASIIGIGINVNQTTFSKNAPNATSLALETGHTFSLYDLVEDLCQQVEQRYLSLKNSNNNDTLRELYLSHLYRFHESSNYQKADGTRFTGTITGISESGKLIIENSGASETFDIKAIRFLN